MALRYHRRINIVPGVHLNISKSGISTTVGVRGASMTFGKHGRYVNTGIPGTGISWRSRMNEPSTVATQENSEPTPLHSHHLHWWKVAIFVLLLIAVSATNSKPFIALFWFSYFAYWFLLFVRLIVRRSRERTHADSSTAS